MIHLIVNLQAIPFTPEVIINLIVLLLAIPLTLGRIINIMVHLLVIPLTLYWLFLEHWIVLLI